MLMRGPRMSAQWPSPHLYANIVDKVQKVGESAAYYPAKAILRRSSIVSRHPFRRNFGRQSFFGRGKGCGWR